MSPHQVVIKIPATTANLGPGFDCLAMALDLWNQFVFTPRDSGYQLHVEGEGAGVISSNPENLAITAFELFFKRFEIPKIPGLQILSSNQVPISSGLGSSATAILAGLLAARSISERIVSDAEILRLACEIEGHPDNVSAALSGGLTVSILDQGEPIVRRFELPRVQAVIILPAVQLPTRQARSVLPAQVPFVDAVFNLGRAALVVEALRSGDLDLLGRCMQDHLHQPYRLGLIPGAQAALEAARSAGAAAAVLSGAGPSLIAFFHGDPEPVSRAMQHALAQHGVSSRKWFLFSTNQGAQIETS